MLPTLNFKSTTTAAQTLTNKWRAQQGSKQQSAELDAELTALARKWAKQTAADETDRRDPVLRVAMTDLVIRFGELLAESADAAALHAGGDDAFSADKMRELMIWQFSEFLTGALIERGDDECYLSLRRWYELDERHAATFWDTTRGGSDFEIVAFEDADGQQVKPASAPAVEQPAPDLRALVANGLRDRNWIDFGMFCNPFTGAAADFDADLPTLLSVITGEDVEDDEPLTLQDTINTLIGVPVMRPVAKPGSMFEVIRGAIDEAVDNDTIDDIVNAVLRVKPAPVPEWETHLRSVIRQRIEEILMQRARAGAVNA